MILTLPGTSTKLSIDLVCWTRGYSSLGRINPGLYRDWRLWKLYVVRFSSSVNFLIPTSDPDDLQLSPIFRTWAPQPFHSTPHFPLQLPLRIGTRGYFFFLLFQCFINGMGRQLLLGDSTRAKLFFAVELDGIDDSPGRHPFACTIVGGPGPWVQFPSHTVLSYLGPQHYILMLDCRWAG